MRLTLTLDNDLIATAEALTGIREHSALIDEAFNALISREIARRLVLLGGTQPGLVYVPRRQVRPSTRRPKRSIA